MGKLTASFRYRVVKQTDARIRILNEVIQGIQTIKMYAWEQPFKKIIGKIRKYVLNRALVLIANFYFFNNFFCQISEKSFVAFGQYS